jgi:hypothetical protein
VAGSLPKETLRAIVEQAMSAHRVQRSYAG